MLPWITEISNYYMHCFRQITVDIYFLGPTGQVRFEPFKRITINTHYGLFF